MTLGQQNKFEAVVVGSFIFHFNPLIAAKNGTYRLVSMKILSHIFCPRVALFSLVICIATAENQLGVSLQLGLLESFRFFI